MDIADPKPISKEIQDAYAAKYINLEALYDGADPFKKTGNTPAEIVGQVTDEEAGAMFDNV